MALSESVSGCLYTAMLPYWIFTTNQTGNEWFTKWTLLGDASARLFEVRSY